MSSLTWAVVGLSLLIVSTAFADEPAEKATELATQASQAFSNGQRERGLELIGKAIAAQPESAPLLHLRSRMYIAMRKPEPAIADLNAVIKLEPKAAELFEQRGSAHFMAGHIAESIADFDKQIALRPDEEISHWKRGISYYYAGRYAEGRKQFEGYQTFDDNDVENAVWRYLCMARSDGVEAARKDLLKIKRDTRVPMAEVYQLFAGQLKPDEVLAAAKAGNPSPGALNSQLFYAHQYLGLWYEAGGNAELALKHTVEAEQHPIGHYMWDVAHVHADRLRAAAKK